MQIGYKNKDPGTEKDGKQIARLAAEFLEKEFNRVIERKYYNRIWTPLALELRLATLDEIIKIFSDKRLEFQQIRRANSWKYKSQDVTYPNLQEDLRRFYPS